MAETVLAEETVARLLLCRFLVQGFTYPDASLLAVLRAHETWNELAAADEVLNLGIALTLADLRACVQGHDGDDERLLTDLQIEHTYLFITARPHVPAPPYESAYFGRGLLMGESVSQVLQAYQEAGLAMNEEFDALPDHIAAELEFMFYLIRQEAEAEDSEVWQERQKRFLAEHLLRWGPQFLRKVQDSARQPFYRHLAPLTEMWLRAEAQRLRMNAPR